MTIEAIDTARLRLVPYSPEHLLAIIEGVAQFEAATGLHAADGLRDGFVSDEVSPDWLARLRASTTPDPWLHGFAVVHRADGCVIGSAAFKGPPAEGVVEIAYGIVPAYRNRGHATEAAGALVAFASGSDAVRVVRAHTLPTPNASTHVLTKCGLTCLGEVTDLEDGLVWRWERLPASVRA